MIKLSFKLFTGLFTHRDKVDNLKERIRFFFCVAYPGCIQIVKYENKIVLLTVQMSNCDWFLDVPMQSIYFNYKTSLGNNSLKSCMRVLSVYSPLETGFTFKLRLTWKKSTIQTSWECCGLSTLVSFI